MVAFHLANDDPLSVLPGLHHQGLFDHDASGVEGALAQGIAGPLGQRNLDGGAVGPDPSRPSSFPCWAGRSCRCTSHCPCRESRTNRCSASRSRIPSSRPRIPRCSPSVPRITDDGVAPGKAVQVHGNPPLRRLVGWRRTSCEKPCRASTAPVAVALDSGSSCLRTG